MRRTNGSAPFTPDVIRSLDYLRQGIAEVAGVDSDLGETLTAIADDLMVNLENQMLLVFANAAVKEDERQSLLVHSRTDVGLLDYYREVQQRIANRSAPFVPNAHSVGRTARQQGAVDGLTPLGGAPSTGPVATPTGGVAAEAAAAASAASVLPETEALRTLGATTYVILEALAHHAQCERCALYLAHRGTGSLRVTSSAPDMSLAARGAFVAMHQGVPGACYSTATAIRVDSVDVELRKLYVGPTDQQLGVETVNTLCFPVVERVSGNVLAVLECANKARAAAWGESDEALCYHAAQLLQYVVGNFPGVDFHSTNPGLHFNPAALHVLAPFRPAPFCDELADTFPAALDARHPQRIARISGVAGLPSAVKGRHQPAVDNAASLTTLLHVREIASYTQKMDESYRQTIAQVVEARHREEAATAELARRLSRIRALEDNVAALHQQLLGARQVINAQALGAATDAANYRDYAAAGGPALGMGAGGGGAWGGGGARGVEPAPALHGAAGALVAHPERGGAAGALSGSPSLPLLSSGGGGGGNVGGGFAAAVNLLSAKRGFGGSPLPGDRGGLAATGGTGTLLRDVSAVLAAVRDTALQQSTAKQRAKLLTPQPLRPKLGALRK